MFIYLHAGMDMYIYISSTHITYLTCLSLCVCVCLTMPSQAYQHNPVLVELQIW